MVIIRLAKPKDLRQVQDLNHELFVSDANHTADLRTNWPYEKEGLVYFRNKIAGGTHGVCLVAEVDGVVMGYVAGALKKPHAAHTSTYAELENICVTASAHDHGLGAKLVEAFYAWCKEQGAARVLVTAFAPNMRAITFYKQQGFSLYTSTLVHDL